ncbi:MAG TPA: peptidase S10 [Thermoanaerobaculia bacterium]|nr:peptidase S10 [Thermoanaerobaculia bacterium]
MRTRKVLGLLAVLSLTSAVALRAAEGEDKEKGERDKGKAAAESPAPRSFVTQHHLQAGGTDLAYTATAEDVYLKDADGKPTADFFTISYTKNGVAHLEERPITFVFNGGPGSASIWLHFGLVGPRTVDIPSDAGDPGAPPYRLRDNPWTILRATDIVFVDPVGTGYSKAAGDKKDKDFWGYDEDADSVAELIRTFITIHNRWNSPKYILGESYGGIRTAMLVPRLQQRLNIGLNGLILISPAINMGTLPFVVGGNDLPFATDLPALAATAYYHKKLPDAWPSQQALLDEAQAFAGGDYLQALFKGDAISAAEKDRIADKLRRYTGLSKQYILRSNLRIYMPRFTKELLRDEGKSIGGLDGRYAQDELDDVAAFPDGDPFDAKTGPIYVANFQSYLRNDLKVDLPQRYVPSNGDANESWKRPEGRNGAFAGYVDVTEGMAQGTKDNEALRIFCAAGYHDLTTSYFATEYMLRHSGIDEKRMTIKTYPGGHMMYLYQPSLQALSNDIVGFIQAAAAPAAAAVVKTASP